jgi:hypothetical protein
LPLLYDRSGYLLACRILRPPGLRRDTGVQPCFKVYEDDWCTAFLDILPARPGHTLLVPKRHAARMSAQSAVVAPVLSVCQITPGRRVRGGAGIRLAGPQPIDMRGDRPAGLQPRPVRYLRCAALQLTVAQKQRVCAGRRYELGSTTNSSSPGRRPCAFPHRARPGLQQASAKRAE